MPPSFGKAETSRNSISLSSRGAEGIRTPGLLHAMQALCQLSYSPGWSAMVPGRHSRNLGSDYDPDPQAGGI